ncbi:MAG: YlxR family protein [Acutalibacteraceae bacterium]|nr:YlxR family protein [Acutalibacteraceae bacterium]
MKQKKIPLRKCTGCNEMKPKKELIRIVRSPEVKNENGEVVEEPQISLDTTGKKSGRGAYVCNNIECLQKAQKARRLERAFSCKIPEEVYTQLEEGMKSLEQ